MHRDEKVIFYGSNYKPLIIIFIILIHLSVCNGDSNATWKNRAEDVRC